MCLHTKMMIHAHCTWSKKTWVRIDGKHSYVYAYWETERRTPIGTDVLRAETNVYILNDKILVLILIIIHNIKIYTVQSVSRGFYIFFSNIHQYQYMTSSHDTPCIFYTWGRQRQTLFSEVYYASRSIYYTKMAFSHAQNRAYMYIVYYFFSVMTILRTLYTNRMLQI